MILNNLAFIGAKLVKALDDNRKQKVFFVQLELFGIETGNIAPSLRWSIINIVENEISYTESNQRKWRQGLDVERDVIRPLYLRAANVTAYCLLGEFTYEVRRCAHHLATLTAEQIFTSLLEGPRQMACNNNPSLEFLVFKSILENGIINKPLVERFIETSSDGIPAEFLCEIIQSPRKK